MANRFEEAAKKGKIPPGGLPEELSAGQEKEQEKVETEQIADNVSAEEDAQNENDAQNAVAEPVQEQERVVNSLVASYEDKRKIEDEPRSVRIQVVVTQSISDKLNDSVAKREIKSKNDLINFLLESYYNSEKTR